MMKKFHVFSRGVTALHTHTHTHTHTHIHGVGIQRVRAFVLILFLLMMKVDVGWGQCGENIIQNPNFLLGLPCTLPNNNASGSFENGCVDGWFAAPPNPHHAMQNPLSPHDKLCDNFNLPWQPYNGSEFTCIAFNEGIFQNISILQNPNLTFEFSIDVAGLQCENSNLGNTMEIRVTKDLVNGMPLFSFINNPKQILITHTITNTNVTTLTVPFSVQPNSGFNQIWIGNKFILGSNIDHGPFTFKNAKLTCNTNALTDITTSISGKQVGFGTMNSDNACQFESFKWNFGDPASGTQNNTSTLPSPIHNFSSPGTYKVCVDIIDCHGCCGSRCEDVVVESNCPQGINCIDIGTSGGTTLLSSLLAGPNPVIPHTTLYFAPIIDGLCFNLEGTLVVDVFGTTFRNTTWYCGPGSGIRINSLGGIWSSAAIVDSRFEGCSTMWKGIFFQPNPLGNYFVGGLSLINSRIHDAYRGVELASGTNIIASGSSFIDNYIGAYIPANAFNGFTDCRFENTGNMKSAYPGQPSWNARMYAGIEAVNGGYARVFGNETNSKSLFKNLSFGIKTFIGGFAAQNTKFEVSDAIAGKDYQSYGIYEEQTNEFSLATDNIFTNNISSCYYSSGGEMHGIQMSNNVFNLSSTFKGGNGVHIVSSKNGNIEINNTNTFIVDGAGGRAINLNNCQYQNLKIDENDFYVEREAGSQDLVSIQSCTPLGGEGLVRENNFYLKKKRDIYITNSPKIVFLKNEFFHDSGRILISGSNNVFVKGNINSNTAKSSWLQISNSKDAKICCNESNAPFYSALSYLGGGNLNSKIVGNQINNLTFYDQTIFGEQPSHSNMFDPSGSAAVALNFQPNALYYDANKFRVDPNQVGHRPLTIDIPALFGDFFPLSGTSSACGDIGSCNSDAYEIPVVDPDSVAYRLMVSNSDVDMAALKEAIRLESDEAQDTPLKLDRINGDDHEQNSNNLYLQNEDAILLLTNYFNSKKVFENEKHPYRSRHTWENHYHLYQSMIENSQIAWHDQIASMESAYVLEEHITPSMMKWHETETKRSNLYKLTEVQAATLLESQKVLKNYNLLIKKWLLISSPEKDEAQLLGYINKFNAARQVILDLNAQVKNRLQESIEGLVSDINALDDELDFLAERKKVWQMEIKVFKFGIETISNDEWNDLSRIAALCPLKYGRAVFEAYGLLLLNQVDAVYPDANNNCDQLESENRSKTSISINEVSISPNPSNGLIHFTGLKNARDITITNLIGETIFHSSINGSQNQMDVDLSDEDNGVYIYSIKFNDQQQKVGKFIILK